MADNGIPLVCNKCKHAWMYKGEKMVFCTCPDCRSLVKIELCRTDKQKVGKVDG